MAADIAVAILGKISEFLVAPIGRQLGYIVRFSCNVETLEDQLEKLEDLKDTAQQEVNVAKNNVETVLKNVETWLDRVSSVAGEARRILEDKARSPKGCLNIKSRHALGRRVKKITLDIVELQKEGKFAKVSLPAPPMPYVVPTSTTLDSREVILNDIIKNLKDENINMVGICGMGGVGKTTMVEKVRKRVMEENMFDDYAKTVVSQKADTTKVQRDIAEMLKLKLEEYNPEVRASRLNQRLEGKKVLIILDDVWEELDLHALGITLQDGQRRCKILFTSRTQRLWLGFGSRRRESSLDTLPYNESWNLFKEKNGDFLDENPDFVPIAEEIVKECGGLPLALVTLGSSLLGKGKHAWNDTLAKLRTKSGVEQKVYESLRLSYDHLGDEEAKSLFLLCSLFEEDSAIFVESLVSMGMGLLLFNGINSIEAARDRVFALVEHLQSRYLVFANSEHPKSIKIHDLVRDVSKSIACHEKGALVLEHGVTLENFQGKSLPEHPIWISVISEEVRELPLKLQFPRLELLRCSNEELHIPDSCFEGMVKLRVVDIISTALLKLPSSFQSLTSLHTLCLQNCRLDDFTAIKFLQSLEILRIADKYIEELPKEIKHLTNLMLLDMSDCEKLRKISPGIISGLTKLKELNLGGLEIDWGAKENEQGRNASLEELNSLSYLRILHIMIKNPRMIPRTPLFGNLKKYQIQIGNRESDSISYEEKKFIRNSQNYERISSISHVALEKNVNFLLHNSEALLLMGKSTKSLVSELVREASQSIKCLEIRETETPEFLANATDCTKAQTLVSTLESLTLDGVINLQQIRNVPLVSGNFAKLKKISVRNCEQIRNIFQLSTAVDTVHLEKIKIDNCRSMKEVISWEGREEEAIRKLQFPKLKKLYIDDVPLVSFCKGANEIIFDQLERLKLRDLEVECIFPDENHLTSSIFPPKVSSPSLNTMALFGLKNMKEIWCGQLQAGSFYNLSQLTVSDCGSLQYVFTACMAKHLVHLHTLEVYNCDGLTEIVKGPLVDGSLVKLKELTVNGCNQLRNTFQLSTAVDILQHLETLTVEDCGSMEEIISWHGRNNLTLDSVLAVECLISISDETPLKSIFPHKVSSPSLNTMALSGLKNMKEIWCGQLQAGSFYNLSQLTVSDCGSLQYVFTACMAKHLVHLHTLEVYNCDGLTEIVKGPLVDGSLVKLKHLRVIGCNQLRNTFQLSTAVDILQHLETLTVQYCGSMEEIISWHGRNNLTLDSVLAVECLISISDETPLKSIFPHKAGSFYNLSELTVRDCGSLQYVFSACMAKYLVHLHTLYVRDCDCLTEIVKGPLVAGSLVKLKQLRVNGCNQLRNTFQLSTAVDILHHLEVLRVENCGSMEEIISWEGERQDVTSKLQFPELRSLIIEFVENLICFCKGANQIEFDQLYSLILRSVPAVECLISISDETPLTSFFPLKVSFPSLNKMELYCLKNMKEIWCGQLQSGSFYNLSQLTVSDCGSLQYVFTACMAKYFVHLHTLYVWNCDGLTEIVQGPLVAGSLVKLKELKVWSCNQLRNTFQLSTAVDILQHLETLTVEDCGSMEEIISWEGERQKDVTSKLQFPELRSLIIENVENLICFCKGANQIEFDQLYHLTLDSVLAVECLVSISDETPLKSIFPHKVSFPRLVEMELKYLENMKEIWCGQPQAGSFSNLSKLDIQKCDSLEYVFSPCMAIYLVHLQKLVIHECKSLKEVVAIKNETDGQKEEDYTSSSILLKLEYVSLYKLEALERFCHIADDLEFPELNDVRIQDCHEFETFTPGVLRTPNLNHVKLYDDYYGETKEEKKLWKGDLNSTIQHLHEDEQLQQRKKQEEQEKGGGGGEEEGEGEGEEEAQKEVAQD